MLAEGSEIHAGPLVIDILLSLRYGLSEKSQLQREGLHWVKVM